MFVSLRWCGLAWMLVVSAAFHAAAADEKAAPGAPLQVHIISGSREYKSEPSLKEFSQHLQENYKVTCTASWGHDGIKELENLDALNDAELMLIFTRRMKLGEEQMQIIRSHWKQGKPIVGVRTASHAFGGDDNKVFDHEVLGNNYRGHYGGEEVKVTAVADNKDHPVLEGVGPFTSRKLYKCGELPETTTVLQVGDIGKAQHPVTMVNEYNGGRVFYTSLGHPHDFEQPAFQRLLKNAVPWTMKLPATRP